MTGRKMNLFEKIVMTLICGIAIYHMGIEIIVSVQKIVERPAKP